VVRTEPVTRAWTSEQRELAAAIREVAADRCGAAERRRIAGDPPHWSPDLWHVLAVDLGVAGIAVDPAGGGSGGTFADIAVAVEAAAAALLPAPVLSHLLGCAAIADCDAGAAVELPGLAAGERTAAIAVSLHPLHLAQGEVTVPRILHGQAADVFVIASPEGVAVVERRDAVVTPGESLDLSRPHACVTFPAAAARDVGGRAEAERLADLLRVGLAVEAVGVAGACLTMTTAHLTVREQFGRPIGSFQALQHRMADLVVAFEAAISTADHAVGAVVDRSPELPVVAPLAKSVCADAAYRIAAETIQLHGGIGFTWEHEAHFYFRRATALTLLLGTSQEQRRLVASRAGIAGAPTDEGFSESGPSVR
jgi:alkylation response protein AidB-like acyl-CoA dehydrogenase